jgi:outer membrane receptor for ferrienterochelin and colicins
MDKESGKSVPFTKIITKKNISGKDTLIYTMTNKVGIATTEFNLPFVIQIDQTGYVKVDKTLESDEDLTVFLDRKVFVIDEIVTTGQYTPQSTQKSVYKINSISEERIVAQSAFNLRELMMTEMNVRVSQDNILGSSISINGFSGQNVKILIDGVPVVGRLDGNIDLSQINLNNARRVEVIEGPMSVMYGTDASGGVINIITKDIVDDKVNLNANSFYESVGTYNFDGSLGFNFGQNNVILSGGRNFFGGYSETDTSRFQRWKPKEQYFGDWQYNGFYESISFRYIGQYFNEYILNRGEPRLPYRESAFDDHYKTIRFNNTISLKGEVAKNRFIDVTANYSLFERKKNTFTKDLVTLVEKVTKDPADQDTSKFDNYMVRANYSHDNVLKSVSYQTGIDLNYSSATGKKIESNLRNVGDYALYASAQHTGLDRFVFQPAVRFIYNTNYEAPIVPSINVKYDLDTEWSFRTSFAKSFRAPDMKELYMNFVDVNHNILGNPDLKAETSNSFIFNVNYHNSAANYSFKVEPGFFYNNVKDLISLAFVEGLDNYTYINIGEFNTMGTNITLSYVRADLSSKIGFSYIGRQYKSSEIAGRTDMVFSPEFMTNIIYNLPLYELRLNIFYKYSGKLITFTAVSDVEYAQIEIDDYHTLDMSLARDFFDNMITFTLGAKNLFDVKDVQQTGVSGGVHSAGGSNPVSWGRTFTLAFRLNVK